MPCRNAQDTLRDCLQSLTSQSYENFEIIALDDGSTDETTAILHEVSRSDSRVRVFERSHRGIVPSLMEASRLARAPLLARMDADDLCEPTRFAEQIELLDGRPEVAIVGCRVRFFPRRGLRQGSLRYESWLNDLLSHAQMRRDLFVESPLAHPSIVIRREAFEHLGGYRDRGWPEDYDLWLRLFLGGLEAYKLPRVLVHWRESPARASRVESRYSLESFFAAKLHFLCSRVLAPRRPIIVWGAGRVGKRWLLALRARGYRVDEVVELDPRKLGKTIHGARVVEPSRLELSRGAMILVAVGALSRRRGEAGRSPWFSAREEIREVLVGRGFKEWDDFLCVA